GWNECAAIGCDRIVLEVSVLCASALRPLPQHPPRPPAASGVRSRDVLDPRNLIMETELILTHRGSNAAAAARSVANRALLVAAATANTDPSMCVVVRVCVMHRVVDDVANDSIESDES